MFLLSIQIKIDILEVQVEDNVAKQRKKDII